MMRRSVSWRVVRGARSAAPLVPRRWCMASPLSRVAQAGRSAEERVAAKYAGRTAAVLALAGSAAALVLIEALDNVPTRAYLRCRLDRWWWQKSEKVVRSEALLCEGNVVEAERPWRTAVAQLSSALGESDWEALEAKIELAGLLVLQGGAEKLDEAERLLRPPSELRRARGGVDSLAAHQELRMVHRLSCQRVSCLAGQGRLTDAEVLARSCVDESIASIPTMVTPRAPPRGGASVCTIIHGWPDAASLSPSAHTSYIAATCIIRDAHAQKAQSRMQPLGLASSLGTAPNDVARASGGRAVSHSRSEWRAEDHTDRGRLSGR